MSDESESDELSQDPAWLELLCGFRDHFWTNRVPAYQSAWADARALEPAQWPIELKRCVHGLAGVAALVDLPDIGDQARRIEQHWDSHGPAALAADMQNLSDQLVLLSSAL